MKQIQGNVLTVQNGIICHQANCQGVMGAGIAKAIRDKWPTVYEIYKMEHKLCLLRLGHVSWAYVGYEYVCDKNGTPFVAASGQAVTKILVASLCSQWEYRPRGICHTDYQAVNDCLVKVRNISKALENLTKHPFPIHIPKGMGCSLAGGDWNVVERIIADIIPEAALFSYK